MCSERRVHFKAKKSSEPDAVEDQPAGKRSSQSTKKAAPAVANSPRYTPLVIICSLIAMLFGMWAGPSLYASDGPVARAWISASSLQLPAVSRAPFPRKRAPPIPAHISSYVQRSIRAALKDPVGRRDFALAADGAKIVPKLTSTFELFSDLSSSPARPPEMILDEDMRSGSHWFIPDSQGQVGIKLPAFIYPTHVTIDHVNREIAADIRQAPRHMVLWGLVDGSGNEQRRLAFQDEFRESALNSTGIAPPIAHNVTFLPLASFEYAVDNDRNVQTFPIDPTVLASRIYFGAVVLEIKTNWGASSTRLYRVRIHGDEVSP